MLRPTPLPSSLKVFSTLALAVLLAKSPALLPSNNLAMKPIPKPSQALHLLLVSEADLCLITAAPPKPAP